MKQTPLQIVFVVCLTLLLVGMTLPSAVADETEETVDAVDEEVEDYPEEEELGEFESDIESMSINGQTLSFGIPGDDDDFHSNLIPDDMKCDACKILAKQFTSAFDKENNKRPSLKKKLSESTIIDILEGECESEFKNVGVKEIKGVKRLSGPGMAIQDAPGVMQGGGKWPFRMQSLCSDIVGEVGDEEIYELYLKGKLESHLCLTKYKSCVTFTRDGRPRIEL